MKLKIYIKYHNKKCKIESHGNWNDLKTADSHIFRSFGEHKLLSLGVSMRLPKYYQANVVPRSSTYKNFGIVQTNHYGVIDGPDKIRPGYSGNDDVWKFSALFIPPHERHIVLEAGDRICQFEVRPTLFAPWWVKLKWLFVNKIEFVEVLDLGDTNRGGFGSTGK